jgi:peptide deformylase
MPANRPHDLAASDGGHQLPRFAQELKRWREQRQMEKKKLAAAMGFHPSYIAHVEAGRSPASEKFARTADGVLGAGGTLWSAWQDERATDAVSQQTGSGESLIVEDDHAHLHYDGRVYRPSQRRRLFNGGTEPVTHYLMRISVDRYPGHPERSNTLYRAQPLTWEHLALTATCDGEPVHSTVKQDRDSFKEVWLRFENDHGKFPLYPGQHAVLEYGYQVDDERWGLWFQRAVRLPTRHLSVELSFPAALDPVVWGTETSTVAEAVPLRTPVTRMDNGDQAVFSWATDNPPIGARYRLEWRFRARPESQTRVTLRTASDRMKAAGIVQLGDPILEQAAKWFNLPHEADAARSVVDELLAAMQRVREHHVFGKGMGLAAPQIGLSQAAAVVQPPDEDTHPIVLLNPTVVAEAGEIDEQYEGCLSFFDVRGLVRRARHLEVEHTGLDGDRTITVFHDGMARLVGHEIDHLHGRLYKNRMRPGTDPIPVEEYRGSGKRWAY